MPGLPVISGQECVRALEKAGYRVTRPRGSHVRLVAPGRSPVTVPLHRELDRGTLRAILCGRPALGRVRRVPVDLVLVQIGVCSATSGSKSSPLSIGFQGA
jgi:predicted RNA binding protein YcfA (HicA-like mRNA interferase family)